MGRRNRKRARARAAESRESIDGQPTFSEIGELVADAIETSLGIDDVTSDVWVCDLTATVAIYMVSGELEDKYEGYWRQAYTIDGETVTLDGAPAAVEQTYVPTKTMPAKAARDTFEGRVIEARGESTDGRRIFAVQIIEHGTSKNGRRYPQAVVTQAAHLYEGAKAFDHHRTDQELSSSAIVGLVGQYRNVTVNASGLEGELHLLPSATHTAEAFDASLEQQKAGLPPLVGISHDVLADWRPVVEAGRRLQEATQITRVLSADVVADPAAGGRATRMVAAMDGTEPQGATMNLKQLLAALRAEADPAKRAALLSEHSAILEASGYTADEMTALATEPVAAAAEVKEPELVGAGVGAGAAGGEQATESLHAKSSALGRMLIKAAVGDAGLNERSVESITKRLPERFTESDLEGIIGVAKEFAHDAATVADLDGMRPRVPGRAMEGVSKDEHDKLVERLDAFFAGDYQKGFNSFKEAFCAITGYNPYTSRDTEDFNRLLLRESFGAYDSARRASESATTATWPETLGDSITRRLVAEYNEPSLQDWRQLTSSIVPINDFRTQRIDRVGGYGVLPTVAEGAPYQALTTPSEEEATYALTKKGGTEDLTLEVIANDDVRWISRIPTRLGLAAARTLHDAIWDILALNPTCTYDSTALFAAGHTNTTAAALSYANYVALRALMRRQAGFGDTRNLLDLTPAILVVPPELEGTADQLCRGDYAPPATSPGATNVPNLAQGTKPIVKARLTDTNDWFLVANPANVPTIEVGFYQGRQDPELFQQSDPTVGAVFNADKFTLKIRHIWSYAVLDHRGFQRGTQ